MDGIKGRLFIIALFSIHSELLTKEDAVKVLQVVDDAVASEFVKKIIGAMARAARVGMQKPNEQQTTPSAERTDGDRSGYELPEELKGLFVVYNKLVQFIRDSHIDPIRKPNLSTSFSFFSRWFSISAMYSWCSNCAIRICIFSSLLRGSCSCLRLPRRSSSPDSPVSLYFSIHVRAWLRLTSCSSLLLRLSDSPTSRLQDLPGSYYFQIHLRHLLAPFPFWRPVVPFSVALLRCIPLPLARAKNSRRILAHSHLEIV